MQTFLSNGKEIKKRRLMLCKYQYHLSIGILKMQERKMFMMGYRKK